MSLSTLLVVNSAEAAPRLLIVDDEEALAKVMQRTLRSRGFESDVAFSGAAARELIDSKEYGLALLDVRLPDESGYGLLEGTEGDCEDGCGHSRAPKR